MAGRTAMRQSVAARWSRSRPEKTPAASLASLLRGNAQGGHMPKTPSGRMDAARIPHKHGAAETEVSEANQAALNDRVYYAEERAAAQPGRRYDGPERRVSPSPH